MVECGVTRGDHRHQELDRQPIGKKYYNTHQVSVREELKSNQHSQSSNSQKIGSFSCFVVTLGSLAANTNRKTIQQAS